MKQASRRQKGPKSRLESQNPPPPYTVRNATKDLKLNHHSMYAAMTQLRPMSVTAASVSVSTYEFSEADLEGLVLLVSISSDSCIFSTSFSMAFPEF